MSNNKRWNLSNPTKYRQKSNCFNIFYDIYIHIYTDRPLKDICTLKYL